MSAKKPLLVTPLVKSIVPWMVEFKAQDKASDYRQVRPLPFNGEPINKVCEALSHSGHQGYANALEDVWNRTVWRWMDWFLAVRHGEKCGDERTRLVAKYGEFPQPTTDSEWQSVFLDVGYATCDLLHELAEIRPLVEKVRRQRVRGKQGDELWRRAQEKLLSLHKDGTLPKSLHKACTAIGEKYDTTRKAVIRDVMLKRCFPKLRSAGVQASEDLLDNLSGTLARQFERLPEPSQAAIEQEWKQGNKNKAIGLVKVLADSQGPRWSGASLIEDADQDGRDND